MDEGDRLVAHAADLRAQVVELFEHRDEILAEMDDDELQALLEVLQGIRRNRERGGPSLN
ncbi:MULTISPECIES: hypothetical protein [Mycobacteriaceae]|uniref:hypothetical protein n=1 Tax=Mycobacteriaceae TaxID=1762 RepID=UPI001CDA51C5|nr:MULTISPECIES: hypothetical protein [unclassified Mycobacterium]MCA2244868.1 hypothetical protein [Mycobacterium sp. WUMAC-067]MCA2316275.1 hypothetical protein [Mycobacterium sp. WUMAC-025]